MFPDLSSAIAAVHVPRDQLIMIVIRCLAPDCAGSVESEASCTSCLFLDKRMPPPLASAKILRACHDTHMANMARPRPDACVMPVRPVVVGPWAPRPVQCPDFLRLWNVFIAARSTGRPLCLVQESMLFDAVRDVCNVDVPRAWRMLVQHKATVTLGTVMRFAKGFGLQVTKQHLEAFIAPRNIDRLAGTPFGLLVAQRASGWVFVTAVAAPSDISCANRLPLPMLLLRPQQGLVYDKALTALRVLKPATTLLDVAAQMAVSMRADVLDADDAEMAPFTAYHMLPMQFVVAQCPANSAIRRNVVRCQAVAVLARVPGERSLFGLVRRSFPETPERRRAMAVMADRFTMLHPPLTYESYILAGAILLILANFALLSDGLAENRVSRASDGTVQIKSGRRQCHPLDLHF